MMEGKQKILKDSIKSSRLNKNYPAEEEGLFKNSNILQVHHHKVSRARAPCHIVPHLNPLSKRETVVTGRKNHIPRSVTEFKYEPSQFSGKHCV